MAQITVPQSQKAALKELATMSEDAYSALQQCLADGRVHDEPNAWLEQTSRAVEGHTRLGGQILGAATLDDWNAAKVIRPQDDVAALAKKYGGKRAVRTLDGKDHLFPADATDAEIRQALAPQYADAEIR